MMKKVTFLIFLIVFSVSSLLSQSSFELIEAESEIYTNDPQKIFGEIEAKFDFKNITSSKKNVIPSIIVDEIADGHQVSLCTYFCYPYTTRSITYNDDIDIPAGDKISNVLSYKPTAHCKPNGNTGQTRIRIRFANSVDENDFIDIPFTFNVGLTSINDIDPSEFIVAYPNPTNGILSVYSEAIKINKIEIFDIHGKKLLSETSNFNYKTLDLTRFPKGSYPMIIYLDNGTVRRQTVIVE